MKYIGIDFGTKRIGLALSDNSGTLAFPLRAVDNDMWNESTTAIDEITEEVFINNVESVVFGKSINYSGVENDAHVHAVKFAEIFEKKLKEKINKDVKVVWHNEMMSSHQASKEFFNASHTEGRKVTAKNSPQQLDASAAAIMLQNYLDLHKK